MQDQNYGAASSSFNPYANDAPQNPGATGQRGPKPPGLENFTEDQILEMYKALETGQVSPELTKLLETMGPPEAN